MINKKLESFFYDVGLYDDEKFKIIEDRKKEIVDLKLEFVNSYSTVLNNGKLDMLVPKISNELTTMVNIGEYARALELLDKRCKISNTSEILPVALQRIYANNYAAIGVKKFLDKKQLMDIDNNCDEKLLIGYALQYDLLNDFNLRRQLNVPNNINYDADKLKKYARCYIKDGLL